MLPIVQGEFRVVADPELRFAPSGIAVGNVRLVANSRKKDQNGEWQDDQVLWLDGVIFKQYAENMVESISKGDLVFMSGRLQTEQWEKDGEKKSKTTVMIDHIGPTLMYATAKVSKAARSQGGGGQSGQQQRGAAVDRPAADVDPWATPSNQGDEPPF